MAPLSFPKQVQGSDAMLARLLIAVPCLAVVLAAVFCFSYRLMVGRDGPPFLVVILVFGSVISAVVAGVALAVWAVG